MNACPNDRFCVVMFQVPILMHVPVHAGGETGESSSSGLGEKREKEGWGGGGRRSVRARSVIFELPSRGQEQHRRTRRGHGIGILVRTSGMSRGRGEPAAVLRELLAARWRLSGCREGARCVGP